MTPFVRKRLHHAGITLSAVVLVLTCAVGGTWLVNTTMAKKQNSVPTAAQTIVPRLILDPGHGGEDGGASTAEGVTEKELNLSVSRRLADLTDLLGISTILTRTEDTLLYDLYGDMPAGGGKKKSYDLKNRLRFAAQYPNAFFCSIHMNKFPSENCSGLQVYYSPHTENSKICAGLVQNYAKTFLDDGNTRQIKKATSAIYLLHRIQTPAILVECGFLSSPTDSMNLQNPVYQTKLAMVIGAALAEGME